MVKDAVSNGCKKIILGLGGSCTNDAGAGLAAALGTVFTDEHDREFIPTGKNLGAVKNIDTTETQKLLADVQITGMCDITNPMYGDEGAAMVFAPQKGASADEVKLLDKQLFLLAATIERCLHIDVSDLKGGGAAGGMGAGIYAFLNGNLLSGIDLILDLVDFDRLLDNCSFVITGEGKLDKQSLDGKVIAGISSRAKAKKVPVFVIAGEKENGLSCLEQFGINAVFETGKIDRTKSLTEIRRSCKSDLYDAAHKLGHYLYRQQL